MVPRVPPLARLVSLLLLALGVAQGDAPTEADPDGWIFATDGAGTTIGISGLAPLTPDAAVCLAVHDAKRSDGTGPRVRRLTRLARGADGAVATRPGAWPLTTLSHDLEATVAVPGRPFEVGVVGSGGAWTCLRLTRDGCCAAPEAHGTLSATGGQSEGLAFATATHGLFAL